MYIDSNSLISVVGSTASGKTSFALRVAEQLITKGHKTGVDIISADSKQVYQGLSILTGADVPPGFAASVDQQFGWQYFSKDKISLHGIAMIPPLADWSVAHFREFGRQIILAAAKHNRGVIIVGGTGLYHRWLFSDDPNLAVPPNESWRHEAAKMDLSQLQTKLQQLNAKHFQDMNHSDQQNPRRLIRAIEIALAQNDESINHPDRLPKVESNNQPNRLTIGMRTDLETLRQKISARVHDRFEGGAVEEVSAMLGEQATHPDHPMFATLGFSEISQYLHQEISVKECQRLWSLHEFQYAKRQITWWKREDVHWVASDEPCILR